MLLAIPLFHVTGLLSCYMSSYRYQRRIVMMYKWDVEKGADIIEREGVTHMTATPAITGDLVAYSRAHRPQIPDARHHRRRRRQPRAPSRSAPSTPCSRRPSPARAGA